MRKVAHERIVAENENLAQRLEALGKMKEDVCKINKKPNFNTLNKKTFRPANSNYETVCSKTNYELTKQQMTLRLEKIQREQERQIEESCTFRPAINGNTQKFLHEGSYVPPTERPLPQKKVEQPKSEEEPEEPRAQSLDNTKKVNRKFDEHFFERQLEWKNSKEEKRVQERLDRELEYHQKMKGIPKVNKKKNEKFFKKEDDFMTRVKEDLHRTKELKTKLDKKYNTFAFKPKTNKNISTNSVVYETILKNTQGSYDGQRAY